jgi:hypothetical protein
MGGQAERKRVVKSMHLLTWPPLPFGVPFLRSTRWLCALLENMDAQVFSGGVLASTPEGHCTAFLVRYLTWMNEVRSWPEIAFVARPTIHSGESVRRAGWHVHRQLCERTKYLFMRKGTPATGFKVLIKF